MTTAAAGRRWLWASYGYAVVVAVVLGYFLLRIPIQVTDSFANIVALERPYLQLMREASQDGYIRPGLWAEMKLVYDLADGNYFHWFRLTQAAQVVALLLLFVRLLQPRTAAAAAAVPLALAVLVGSHTFAWTVREAFPINTFLTILVCCIIAANLSFAASRRWHDVFAVVLFAIAALTVESGVLIWVIFAGGYLLGLRGVSKPALALTTALLVVYLGSRVALGIGLPRLLEREAGFGFQRYDGLEIVERFGGNVWPFYAYNVGASALNVLFAEPRDGVWRVTSGLVRRELEPALVVNVVSTTLATAVVAWWIWSRRRGWRAWSLDRDDRLVLLFGGVLAANAVISYAYTKDVIMSPAGLFFAAAVFVAVRGAVERLGRPGRRLLLTAVLAAVSVSWAVRAVGIHAALARTSFQVREQWAYIDDWLARTGRDLDPRALALKQQLQEDAVVHHPPKPPLRERWTALFDIE